MPTVREPEKCTEIAWFAPEAVPEAELTLISRENLRHYRERVTEERKFGR